MEITVLTIAFPVIKVSIFAYTQKQDGCLVTNYTHTSKACRTRKILPTRMELNAWRLDGTQARTKLHAHTLVSFFSFNYFFILMRGNFLELFTIYCFQVLWSQFVIHLCCSGNLHFDNDAYPIQITAPVCPGFVYF